jgi:transposase InsO family protein
VGNAFRHGFYWPTAVADASEIVRTCEGCQFYASKTNLPAHTLQTIPVTWPFAVWGLDIVRPLRKAPGGYAHLLVAIDKFSKWVEVHLITNLRVEQAVTFFTDIIYQFGVPNSIITENGSQFTGRKFLEFCDKFHIRVDWATVAHPQTNGQVERANSMILQGLKPRIFDRLNKSDRKWLQELPVVVWSLRTTPSRATGFTLFFLVNGTEAVLPMDLEYGLPRVQGYDEGTNQRAREDSLDQLDEARTVALMHSARYQQALRRYQAQKIRRRDFNEGDLVLRLRQDNRGRHKISPPWEGPYVVVKVLKPGTYKLAKTIEAATSYHPHGRDPTSWSRCSSPALTSWPTRMVKNSPTLGTSNSYVTSTLRKDFQAPFIIYTPNTPVGCTNVNSIEINKYKGKLGFPLKPKSPSGATIGGHPPPQNGPIFFAKNHRKCTKYASTQVLGELTRDASSQRAKKRESGIAYTSSRIWPFPLATSPTSFV